MVRPLRRDIAPVLGIDFGGVIGGGPDTTQDTSFWGGRPMETPQLPGAFQAVRRLIALFDGRVWIVSKAYPRVEGLTRQWLDHHDIYTRTGLQRDSVHFVLERIDKAPMCVDLGITHFVDDRLDVLEHLTTVAHRLWFRAAGLEVDPSETPPEWCTPVFGWDEVEAAIALTLE